MIALLVTACAALAGAVVEPLSVGRVDWTRGVIEVDAASEPVGGGFGPVEQRARSRLELGVLQAAREVRIGPGRLAGDIMDARGEAARVLGDGLGTWRVVEARYHSSGRVELAAELSLLEWLRPLLAGGARAVDEGMLSHPRYTGVVVDARGTGAAPCFAPRIVSAGGRLLYGPGSAGQLALSERAPVLWVDDPADPRAAARAGTDPLWVVASGLAGDGSILLAGDDAAALAALHGSALLAAAPVVVVVEPR